jgi:hypothetical protein
MHIFLCIYVPRLPDNIPHPFNTVANFPVKLGGSAFQKIETKNAASGMKIVLKYYSFFNIRIFCYGQRKRIH